MKSVEFCYWLQGLFEVGEPTSLNEKQTDLIKRHLNMVFIHEIDLTYPATQQDALEMAHEGHVKTEVKVGTQSQSNTASNTKMTTPRC